MGSINLGTASSYFESFGISKAAATKVFSVIKRKPMIDSLEDKGLKPTDIVGSIEFKNVSFEYPSRPKAKVSFDLFICINLV
jgi:ABC-type multidrug transport system fused ATPase/permease subunit